MPSKISVPFWTVGLAAVTGAPGSSEGRSRSLMSEKSSSALLLAPPKGSPSSTFCTLLRPVTELIAEIMDDGNDNIAAKIQVAQLQKVESKVIVNVGMELSNLATLVTDPAIITAFSPNDKYGAIDWMELNLATDEPFDIILEIPEAKLEQWKPMTMLMINQLIRALMQRAERSYKDGEEAPPVLVMLDEFARLGKVSAIKEGLATLRSRGLTFALFIQGLAQLDEEYGATAA